MSCDIKDRMCDINVANIKIENRKELQAFPFFGVLKRPCLIT
jgi:hypothetical protein